MACLVEAEIVSPYHGILMKTGVGNPTAPSITALGDKRVYQAGWEAHSFFCPYKGSRDSAPPHLPGKLAYSPSAVIDGAVGLPTPVLMRIL